MHVGFSVLAAFVILFFPRYFVADWRLRLALAALYPLHFLAGVRWVIRPLARFRPKFAPLPRCWRARIICACIPPRARVVLAASVLMFFAVWARPSALPFAMLIPLCFALKNPPDRLRDKIFAWARQLRPVLFLPLAAGFVASQIRSASPPWRSMHLPS